MVLNSFFNMSLVSDILPLMSGIMSLMSGITSLASDIHGVPFCRIRQNGHPKIWRNGMTADAFIRVAGSTPLALRFFLSSLFLNAKIEKNTIYL